MGKKITFFLIGLLVLSCLSAAQDSDELEEESLEESSSDEHQFIIGAELGAEIEDTSQIRGPNSIVYVYDLLIGYKYSSDEYGELKVTLNYQAAVDNFRYGDEKIGVELEYEIEKELNKYEFEINALFPLENGQDIEGDMKFKLKRDFDFAKFAFEFQFDYHPIFFETLQFGLTQDFEVFPDFDVGFGGRIEMDGFKNNYVWRPRVTFFSVIGVVDADFLEMEVEWRFSRDWKQQALAVQLEWDIEPLTLVLECDVDLRPVIGVAPKIGIEYNF